MYSAEYPVCRRGPAEIQVQAGECLSQQPAEPAEPVEELDDQEEARRRPVTEIRDPRLYRRDPPGACQRDNGAAEQLYRDPEADDRLEIQPRLVLWRLSGGHSTASGGQ